MKKLLVLTMVLVICSMANAMLKISVDGVVDPQQEIRIDASDYVTIDVYSDGILTSPAQDFFLIAEGPGAWDVSKATNTVNPPGYPDSVMIADWTMENDVFLDLSILAIPIPPLPAGTLIDLITLHCEGPGDVLISLVGSTDGVLDTQIIHQIPEPMTIALLGLGGLFLRRRK